jgi:type IV pilus assembly protein PilB
MPLWFRGPTLVLAMPRPQDIPTREKLEFILNRDIEAVAASQGQVTEAFQRHYGNVETESVDCILVSDFAAFEAAAEPGTYRRGGTSRSGR